MNQICKIYEPIIQSQQPLLALGQCKYYYHINSDVPLFEYSCILYIIFIILHISRCFCHVYFFEYQ